MDWVRRLASWHGPSPQLVFAIFGSLTLLVILFDIAKDPKTFNSQYVEPLVNGFRNVHLGGGDHGSLLNGALCVSKILVICIVFLAVLQKVLSCIISSRRWQWEEKLFKVIGFELGYVQINLFTGLLSFRECTLWNAEGCNNEHAIRVDSVSMALWCFLRSFFHEVAFEKVVLKGIVAVIEFDGLPMLGGRSNLEEILHKVRQTIIENILRNLSLQSVDKEDFLSGPQVSHPKRITVRRVEFENVEARATNERGLRLPISNFVCDNFSAEHEIKNYQDLVLALTTTTANALLEKAYAPGVVEYFGSENHAAV